MGGTGNHVKQNKPDLKKTNFTYFLLLVKQNLKRKTMGGGVGPRRRGEKALVRM